jgi:hypothetical protein
MSISTDANSSRTDHLVNMTTTDPPDLTHFQAKVYQSHQHDNNTTDRCLSFRVVVVVVTSKEGKMTDNPSNAKRPRYSSQPDHHRAVPSPSSSFFFPWFSSKKRAPDLIKRTHPRPPIHLWRGTPPARVEEEGFGVLVRPVVIKRSPGRDATNDDCSKQMSLSTTGHGSCPKGREIDHSRAIRPGGFWVIKGRLLS